MEPLFIRLLNYYHLSEEEYVQLVRPVTTDNFFGEHNFDNIDQCAKLVKDAMTNNKKIYIYGDYDCDGVISISILVKMFALFNYPITYHVPNRYLDGYGLNLKRAEEIVNDGIDMIITVDNGITAFEGLAYAKAHGLQVLIIDHHQPDKVLPEADAILHPLLSHFGVTPTSAGFTTFMFAKAMLGRFDSYLAVLAAISVISDMMPLVNYNRDFLRLVIANYQDNLYPCIDLLKEGEPFNEVTIGMRISPKINAIGRLVDNDQEMRRIIDFLTNDNPDLLLNYIQWINSVNSERKDVTKTASENSKEVDISEAAIVALIPEKEGVIGLIANSFTKKYHKPAIVFALDQTGDFYKGSCRSPKGFNVVDAFKKLGDLVETSGGHAMAGGCTIKKEYFEEFKTRFIALAKEAVIEEEEEEVIALYLNEMTFENFDVVSAFSPFGENWPSPKFMLSRIRVASLMYSRDGQHIITAVGNNAKISGFYFSKQMLTEYQFVNLIGTLRLSRYNHRTSLEFLVSEIINSEK